MTQADLVPRIETDRLVLRGHRRADFPAMAAMWADPDVVARISGTPSTEAETWARFLRYAGLWAHLGFGYWAVTLKADGRFLGEAGFADFRRDTVPDFSGVPEAGWVFRSSVAGQGVATEAVHAMTGWADRHLDADRVFAIFDPDHGASVRVARKAGFRGDISGRFGDTPALFLTRDRTPAPPDARRA